MSIHFRSERSIPADRFEAAGGLWNPDVHFIVMPSDEIAAKNVQSILDRYASGVVAHWIQEIDGGCYSIELQFSDPQVGDQCKKEYCRGWQSGGPVTIAKKAQKQRATKRLFKHRMYILPEGTEFLYCGVYDGHGYVWGKVQVPEAGPGKVTNQVVHRSVLEKCRSRI